MKQKLIIIAGLTASGKSDYAQHLAHHLNTRIIVGDSLQMYQNWRIASNWPNNQQQYDLLGTIDGKQQSLNAAQYKNLVEHQMKKYSNCLIEGGCCFYLNYLLNSGKEKFTEQQICEADKKAEGLINRSQDVQQLLQQHCASYDKSISSNDFYRITKALRYALLSNGEYFQNSQTDPSDTINQQYDIRGIFLSGSQDYINQRIYLRYGILYYHLMQLDAIKWSNGGMRRTVPIGYAEFSNLFQKVKNEQIFYISQQKFDKIKRKTLSDTISQFYVKSRKYALYQRKYCRNNLNNFIWIDPEQGNADKIILQLIQMDNIEYQKQVDSEQNTLLKEQRFGSQLGKQTFPQPVEELVDKMLIRLNQLNLREQ